MNEKNLMHAEVAIVDYEKEMAFEINQLWRISFDKALDIKQRSSRDSVENQLAYLEDVLANDAQISVVVEKSRSRIIGFMAQKRNVIEQLYLHPDFQGKGHGKRLINLAKSRSSGELTLYTFQLNLNAQKFYQTVGFEEVSRGCADMDSNPWADTQSQLADICYRWQGDTGKD
ncbi:MAG: ribosomal protein S18 acetylase RimI-like enzyme [Flavobacterium sp.]